MSNFYPYTSGNIIELISSDGGLMKAEVVEILTTTMACVMVIQRLDTERCILKLYDRRFAAGLRKDQKAAAWTPWLEHEYQALVNSGKESVLFDRWDADLEDNEDESDLSIEEAWLQYECYRSYKTEVRAYDLLHDIQGTKVPYLLGKVALSLDASDKANRQYSCPGILLQYIPGFLLTDLADNMERSHWQDACDQAIDTIQQTTERGILNRDVKTRSFIVCEQADGSPHVVMIDFGLCDFRDQFEDEQKWRERQAIQDEEGAIGLVMSHKLKGGFRYRESDRALRLSYDFMREEGYSPAETYEQFAERCRRERVR